MGKGVDGELAGDTTSLHLDVNGSGSFEGHSKLLCHVWNNQAGLQLCSLCEIQAAIADELGLTKQSGYKSLQQDKFRGYFCSHLERLEL